VAGDRNITQISGVVLESVVSAPPKWVEGVGLHGAKGNLLFGDGHVEEVNSAGLGNSLVRVGIATNRFSIP
jgi:prepilin-type processing-associated H-X9-DG protein